MKNSSILLLVGTVIVIGIIGYAVTQKAPTEAPVAEQSATQEVGDDAMTTDEAMTDHATEDGSLIDVAADIALTTEAPDVTVEISGRNFAFDKEEIRVKEGQTVKVVFTSASGFHDWVVDEFSARTAQVMTGNSSSVTFVADKKGTFEYYCSVGAHRANGMYGKLIVE
jgi:nitrite reductase (NO-forming)